MKAPIGDIMKSMMRSILAYSYYDHNALDTSVGNSLHQCLELISVFPMFAAYVYHSYTHYKKGGSMYIHIPDPKLSAAEKFFEPPGYLFDYDGGYGIFERFQARWREFEIYQHDGRHSRTRQRLLRPR